MNIENKANELIGKARAEKNQYHKNSNVRLTPRDLDMLEFINDMKFASVKEVHERFFIRKSDKLERPVFAAKNRLYALSTGGYLTTEKIGEPDITAFVVTQRGVLALSNFKPMRSHPKALGKIEMAVFHHDYAVLKARLFLEKHNFISSWMSERLMEAEAKVTGGLSTDYHPDAIYVLPTGERVAFEFERTSKNRDRYLKKINKFYDLIKESENPIFEKVQYVCVMPAIQKMITSLSEMYREHFQAEMVDEFIKRVESTDVRLDNLKSENPTEAQVVA